MQSRTCLPVRVAPLEKPRTAGDSNHHLIRPERRPARVERPRPDIQSRVIAALMESKYAALAFIGCEVHQSHVILRGSVPSYHLKQLAQVFAQRVDGVGRIDNRLKVQGASRPE
jgi:osmotically-inducible protein OsmY